MNRRKKWLVVVPIILFAMLAVCIQARLSVPFDEWAYSEAVEGMSPNLTMAMKGITNIGDSIVIIIFCLVLFIIPKLRRTIALPVSITVISSAIFNVVLKHIFARSRPNILQLINETGYSFPSGHAMNNAALYTMLILMIWRYFKNTSLKIILSLVCVVTTGLIGYSRVYLGVHYADDVLGGWLFGFAISMLVYLLWDMTDIKSGDQITKGMVSEISMTSLNQPDSVVKKADEVVGKYASMDMIKGDTVLREKISDAPYTENTYLSGLDGTKRAISVSIKALANGLSGKLKSGDIVAVIAPNYRKMGTTVIPNELQYVEVIAATSKSGTDMDGENQTQSADKAEKELPATVTLLASEKQCKLLAELESEGELHLALVYRGTKENAEKFLKAQDELNGSEATANANN